MDKKFTFRKVAILGMRLAERILRKRAEGLE